MWPGEFFARELRPSHRRIVEAARTATKATITTGLAATMQILGPFGSLFAFRIGQPGISLGIFEGALTIATAAVMQAAIVPITGKLLDYPGLLMAFLFVVFAAIAYLLSNTRLFLILALVAIGTITTVYVGIFNPGQIGWGSTYTFDGILVATLVMVVIDTLVWPSPPEPRLLESIAGDLEHTRARLELVGQHYLDPSAPSLPAPLVTSMLSRNLALMKPVEERIKPPPQRLAALLDAVMMAEHAYLEVEHLAVLADEPVSHEIRQRHRDEIQRALQGLDKVLEEKIVDILGGLDSSRQSSGYISDLHLAIQGLTELSTQVPPACDEFIPLGQVNFLGFVGGLEEIANLLESRDRPIALTPAASVGAETDSEPRPFFEPARLRFSIKLGASITLGLLVGLTTQRADLQTILWSIAVASQPNQYGAVVRKTLLRLAGCALGGLAALAAMVLVSQNFDSLPPYLLTIFVVTIFSTYVSQSDEWLGYAGIQAGITFLICYVGLGPTSDVYRPLWRFWGIVLGVMTTGLVFLVLWPEYASDKVVESLKKLMRITIALGKEAAEGKLTEERISAVERRFSANLLDVLTMADQARLEGRRGRVNSGAAIQAASVMVRIAYRFEIIARRRIAEPPVVLSTHLLEYQATFEQACCAVLETQLANLEKSEPAESPTSSSSAAVTDLASMTNDLALGSTRLPADSRLILGRELESYRRLPILLVSLDTALSRITTS